MRLIDADALMPNAKYKGAYDIVNAYDIVKAPTIDAVPVIRCKDCKHNPKQEWFGCPMSHLSEKQRPETAWCWKAERKEDG